MEVCNYAIYRALHMHDRKDIIAQRNAVTLSRTAIRGLNLLPISLKHDEIYEHVL
jgi:hypothetical protein